ncbi:hypothetical protein, partial [Commensalibacter sp. Nvir]|uniref:hypothetical protein n=1 Tax=Commensalibacter sp. Nvir TaxID=3069817 RepID=UPI0030C80F06
MTDTPTKINVPFASKGDKTFPPVTDNQGRVNFTQGYTGDYELDLNSGDVNAKPIERRDFNGLFNIITANLMQWQQHTFPTWYQDNGTGYAAGAYVSVTNAAGEVIIYRSLVDDNLSDPQTDQLGQWEVVLSQTELLSKVAFLRGGGDLNQFVNTTGKIDLNTVADGFYFFEKGAVNKPSDVGIRFYLMTIKTTSNLGTQLLIDDNFHLYGRYINGKTLYPWLRYDRELLKTYNNLSDLSNVDTARINLNLEDLYLGGIKTFDKTVSDAKGGYPSGVILQSSDTTKPWVLWQNVQDNNTADPNQNDIASSETQNGWVRYPVLLDSIASNLSYNSEGKLEVSTQVVSVERYVSSSTGKDDTGNGSKDNPFFSIAKAINSTPGNANVTIYLRDQDTHYWSPDGKQAAIKGELNIGERYLKFMPYDDAGKYESIKTDIKNRNSDETWSFCLSPTYLSGVGLSRPKIVILWDYVNIYNGTSWVKTYTSMYTINGLIPNFYCSFFGVEFAIDRVDELSKSNLDQIAAWATNGGRYQFIGCIFNTLPSSGQHWLLGGNADFATGFVFAYANLFMDTVGTGLLMYQVFLWDVHVDG